MKELSHKALLDILDPEHHDTVQRWLDRGDGVAVYVNQDFGSFHAGHRQFVSYGGPSAQIILTGDEKGPPTRMPDIGGSINWAYQLEWVVPNPTMARKAPPLPLTQMTVVALRAEATRLGVPYTSKIRKVDLIQLLSEYHET